MLSTVSLSPFSLNSFSRDGNPSKLSSPSMPLLLFLQLPLLLVLQLMVYFPTPFFPINFSNTPFFSRTFFPEPSGPTSLSTFFIYKMRNSSKLSLAACVEQSACKYMNMPSMRRRSSCMLSGSIPLSLKELVCE